MFKKIGPNAAESSEGFQVERSGRAEIRYSQGELKFKLEVEPGNALAIYTNSIVGWEDSDEPVALTPDQRERVLQNISAALEFLNIPHVLA
jgi:hypothetical protein